LGRIVVSGIAGVTASFVSMLCCTGPLLLASLGVSGAGLSAMRPYRPVFLALTGGSLYLAYWLLERADTGSCESGRPCADPRARRRVKWVLWVMTGIAFVFASSPRWAGWVFG